MPHHLMECEWPKLTRQTKENMYPAQKIQTGHSLPTGNPLVPGLQT